MASKPKNKQGQGRKRGAPTGGSTRRKPCYFCKEKVEEIDYKNYNQLRRYTSEKGKIRSRRISGACRRHQRQVAVAVKRAREVALLALRRQLNIFHAASGRFGARGVVTPGASVQRWRRGAPARLKRKEMASKATQAILLQDVEKLGRKGDVVHVAAGYMRNYLGPRKLAEAATDARVAEVQRQAEQRRRHEAQSDEQARDMAHTLNRTVLTIKRRAGTEDRLYGSVTSTDISDAIWQARRIRIDRRKVELDEPIKTLGSHRVQLTVYGDVRPCSR